MSERGVKTRLLPYILAPRNGKVVVGTVNSRVVVIELVRIEREAAHSLVARPGFGW